jgi:hypothetical protein
MVLRRKGFVDMRSWKTALWSVAVLALLSGGKTAQAAPCSGVTFGASFAGSYTCNSLGTPLGVAGPLGGITFLNNSTLLVGGAANGGAGYIAQISVTRDAQNHITGFSGVSSLFATAPFIDGGLSFGPGGVLFATGYPNNTMMQFKPGSVTPDRTDTLPANVSSVGSLVFVPVGFAGAGTMKVLSYNQNTVVDATLTPDGFGTFNLSLGSTITTLIGGVEGAAYANAGFGGVDSMLVSEWGAGNVGAYQIDGSGNPIAGTRQDFLIGLSGAEGALIDPMTGDFIFSTFGGGDQVFVIQGFTPPPSTEVPEPVSAVLLLIGGAVSLIAKRRQQ